MFDPPLPTAEWRWTEAPDESSGITVDGPAAGAPVGDYVLVNSLDSRRGARRYRARHRTTGFIVALSLFDGPPPQRFRELQALRHPALVDILDVGEDHVAFEIAEGDRLSDLLARDGRFLPADALTVAATLADVLALVEAAGHSVRRLDAAAIRVDTRKRPWRVRVEDLEIEPRGIGDESDALAGLTYRMLSGRLPDGACPVGFGEAATLGPGARVGRFRVIGRLGEGGMGVVFSAYDPDLDRRVALKVLRAEVGADGSASAGRQRLLREARALARLRHPNVIAVHEVGADADRVYLAMELAEGTLRGWLGSGRPWRDVLARFTEAGRGLAAAHDAGLVHRDFKPENVLLAEGTARIGDFGLVSASVGEPADGDGDLEPEEDERGPLTQEGAVVGTPGYMAPEQMRGEPVGPAADQFAFCVALWEALYGARPFVRNGGKLLDAIARGPLPPPRTDVPPAIRALLERGLCPLPRDRFPSMAELLSALERSVTPCACASEMP